MLTVIDPGDNVTLSIRGGLPVNSVLERVDEEEYIFIWTLMELTNKPLVFVANDSRGAASTFSPVVEVCACVNGGACTREGVITSNATVTLKCMCTEGMLPVVSCVILQPSYYGHDNCNSIQWRVL